LALFLVRKLEIETGQGWDTMREFPQRLHIKESRSKDGRVFQRSELTRESLVLPIKDLTRSFPAPSMDSFKYMILYRLIPLGYYLLRFYLSFVRVRVTGEEIALGCLADYGRLIVAVWHQRFLPALAYVTKFRYFKPIVMISPSRDGELMARLAGRLGLVPVRGSSSRGGTTALKAIMEALKKYPAVIHIVDGPLGPKGIVKPGIVSMAQVSGAVILPVIVSADRAWIMGSWDRFLVPKPFGNVTIQWGQPIVVPRNLDSAQKFEKFRREIEKRLRDGHAEADLNAGWNHPL